MSNTYFWTPKPIGLKADIERHREEEKRLLNLIDKMRDAYEGTDNENALKRLRFYLRALDALRVSKAQVLDKLGRKK